MGKQKQKTKKHSKKWGGEFASPIMNEHGTFCTNMFLFCLLFTSMSAEQFFHCEVAEVAKEKYFFLLLPHKNLFLHHQQRANQHQIFFSELFLQTEGDTPLHDSEN